MVFKICAICGKLLTGRTGYQTIKGKDFCLRHNEAQIYHSLESEGV
jgi:hypothetical protein